MLDQVEGAIQMAARFLMHGDPINSGFGEGPDVLVWILYHEMAIERQPGCFAERFHYRRANREIGHKMTVHDIDVDEAGATGRGLLDLIRQMGEVGRKYRRCEFDQNRSRKTGKSLESGESVEILARPGRPSPSFTCIAYSCRTT